MGDKNIRAGGNRLPSSWWDIFKEQHAGGDVAGDQLELHILPLLGGLTRGLTRGESKTIPFICQGCVRAGLLQPAETQLNC